MGAAVVALAGAVVGLWRAYRAEVAKRFKALDRYGKLLEDLRDENR